MTRKEIEALKEDKAGLAENLIRAEARIVELEEQVQLRDNAATEMTKDYAEWMSPEDYVPLAQKVKAQAEELRVLRERVAQADRTIYDTGDLEAAFSAQAAQIERLVESLAEYEAGELGTENAMLRASLENESERCVCAIRAWLGNHEVDYLRGPELDHAIHSALAAQEKEPRT